MRMFYSGGVLTVRELWLICSHPKPRKEDFIFLEKPDQIQIYHLADSKRDKNKMYLPNVHISNYYLKARG